MGWIDKIFSPAEQFNLARFVGRQIGLTAWSAANRRHDAVKPESAAEAAVKLIHESKVGADGNVDKTWMRGLWKVGVKKFRQQRRAKRGRRKWITSAVQPPITQFDKKLIPANDEEVILEPLLSRANLVIARDIEWANIIFSFEQESRYVILDPYFPQSPVGIIREKSNVIVRQLLRSRRPFVASITDATGEEIFKVRRPFWLINSTIYAEVNGKQLGVVHRRWHLWQRIYDLYLGNKQFATVQNPGFWNWNFTLKDEDDQTLAVIDRNWRGIGLELFTDAGQYVIRFGDSGSPLRISVDTNSDDHVEDVQVDRPLTLSERAVAIALGISLDTDYFSRQGGWGLPFLLATE